MDTTDTAQPVRRPAVVNYHGSLTDQHGRYYLIGRCPCDTCWDDLPPSDQRWELDNGLGDILLHVRDSSFAPDRTSR